MKHSYKFLAIITILVASAAPAYALSIFNVGQGGTGVGAPSGFMSSQLLYGNGLNPLSSVATSSATCSSGVSCTAFTVVGAAGPTITNSGVTSIAGTANQITSSGSTGSLTLSLPSLVIFPNNASSTLFSTTYASSTRDFIGTLTLPLLTGTQCLHEISGVVSGTGSDCGSGTGSSDFSFTTNYGQHVAATSSKVWFQNTLYASSTFQFDQNTLSIPSAVKYIDWQRDAQSDPNDGYTLMRIRAPKTNSDESTLTLYNDLNGDNSDINVSFVDFYNENYPDSNQSGIRLFNAGTAPQKPFVLGYKTPTGNKDAQNVFGILPAGTVFAANATSTVPADVKFYVASSTATTLARIDTTPGTVRFGFGSAGDFVQTGTSGSLTFNPNVDGGDFNINSSNGSQSLAFFGSAANTLSLKLLDGTLTLTPLATAGGAFLAVNSAGVVIATSTPAGGAVGFGAAGQFPFYSSPGTTLTGSFFGYASSTNHATLFGSSAGGQNATTSATIKDTVAIGFNSLNRLTTGDGNVGIGSSALLLATTSPRNTAVGYQALSGTGAGTWSSGGQNVAIGYSALTSQTTGAFNTAVGYLSGSVVTTGSGNTLLGYETNASAAAGDYNTSVGYGQGNLVTGYGNTLLGSNTTGGNLTSGSGNVGIGSEIFFPSITGNRQLNIGNILFGILPATSTSYTVPATGGIGIGTSSPFATFSIGSVSSTQDPFSVATSTGAGTQVFGIDNDGHTYSSGPAPVISSCGTGSGTVVGDDQSGTITTATAATACTATFSKAYKNTPTCTVVDNSLVGFADISAISVTAVTFGISSALTGGLLYYQCSYHR